MNNVSNIEGLIKAVEGRNPVVIAGYSRESTHKGYLSWILDSARNEDSALALVKTLISKTDLRDKDFDWVEVVQEASTENCHAKIDLVLNLYKDETGPICQVPIELKVESGPSGEHQIPELKKQTSFIMLLGGSSAHDLWCNTELGQCVLLRPADLIVVFQDQYDCSGQFVRDWIDAVQMEKAREELALDVLAKAEQIESTEKVKSTRHKRVARLLFHDLDYASDKHMWYYVYRHFKRSQAGFQNWVIGDANFNPVLSEREYQNPSRIIEIGARKAHLYFEFAYGDLLIKANFVGDSVGSCNEEEEQHWRSWKESSAEQIVQACADAGLQVKSTAMKFGNNPALVRMQLRWSDGLPMIASNTRLLMQATEDWLRRRG